MSAETTDMMQRHLAAARRARAAADAHPVAAARRDALRRWQADRLAATYADLLATPRFAAAARFFLSDLYSTTDTGQRDSELERALPKMVRMLPASALEPLALALEADALAEYLDAELATRLFAVDDLPITEARYVAAYRACANRPDRERQIALIDAIGRDLDRVARRPLIATAVRMMRGPAGAAGFGALQGFLERGLAAFQAMKGAADFLETVKARESRLMNEMFGNSATPATH